MRRLLLLLLCLAFVVPVHAHVGSKDIFEQVQAGPYKLYVTVRPPDVIPGVAVVEVRVSGDAVPDTLRITPVPMVGEASKHPPTPDTLRVSAQDAKFFTGSVWLMSSGSWKVSVLADGPAGSGTGSVPVPAVAVKMLRMSRSIAMVLGVLGLLLVVGIAAIVAAAARESRLTPGTKPSAFNNRRAWIAGGVTLALVLTAVWLGGKWWDVEAADYGEGVYRPLSLTPTLKNGTLDLVVGKDADSSYWQRKNTDLLPDHGHLMHLYAIREPGMDAVFHLHPTLAGPGDLKMALPAMPAGHYRLFADIVHKSGLPETLTAKLDVPQDFHGGALAAEDAAASPTPITANELGAQFHLPDGYTMTWDKPESLKADEASLFRFQLLDASGKPAHDVVPYLGMSGHAAFVRDDFSTFAHTHPEGSAPMQSMEVANGESSDMAAPPMDSMATMHGMTMPEQHLPPTVEFPYGFPKSGRYRIFVQMKHGNTVETGVFDADVQ
ncbi:MAG: hypothetical protein V4734_09490 [Terriglobus sp.]